MLEGTFFILGELVKFNFSRFDGKSTILVAVMNKADPEILCLEFSIANGLYN